MKTKFILFPMAAALLIGGLTGCGSHPSKFQLTYGTYADVGVRDISYSTLRQKMGEGESMLIATYPNKTTCGCWEIFKGKIAELTREYHYCVYSINHTEFTQGRDQFGLSVDDLDIGFNIVKNGKTVYSNIYNASKHENYYQSSDALLTFINNYTYQPQMFYLPAIELTSKDPSRYPVSEYYLDKMISEKQSFVAIYYFSSCGDCKYAFPKIVYPYLENNDTKIPVYAIDVDVEGVRMVDGDHPKENPQYQAFKDKHQLSKAGNAQLGYNNGYVPTFQYYENGVLKDAAVCFNDTITLENGKYIVSDSFYTEERIKYLGYDANVLKGKELTESQLDIYDIDANTKYYAWKKEDAATSYRPLIESFFNKYII